MVSSDLRAETIFSVNGMVAVITGGGTGLGLTMAKTLAANGAKAIYILGRRKEKLEAAAAGNPVLIPVVCDVTSKQSLQAAVDRVTADFGYVNLVVANAGTANNFGHWDILKSVQENRKAIFDNYDMQQYTDVLHINVSTVFFTFLAFVELLEAGNKAALEGGFGAPIVPGGDVLSVQSQLIITSSVAGFIRQSSPSSTNYGSSKAAVTHMAKQLSTSLASQGIRVNALAPGFYHSELTDFLINIRDPSEEAPGHPEFIPARRFGADEDMAGTILYLAGRGGAFCNGLVIVHDGGRLCVIPSTY